MAKKCLRRYKGDTVVFDQREQIIVLGDDEFCASGFRCGNEYVVLSIPGNWMQIPNFNLFGFRNTIENRAKISGRCPAKFVRYLWPTENVKVLSDDWLRDNRRVPVRIFEYDLPRPRKWINEPSYKNNGVNDSSLHQFLRFSARTSATVDSISAMSSSSLMPLSRIACLAGA